MAEGVVSSIVSCFVVLLLCFLYSLIGTKNNRALAIKVFAVTSLVYLLSMFIASSSFSEIRYFSVSDCRKYIVMAEEMHDFSWNLDVKPLLVECYLLLGDNNALYNIIVRFIGYLFNTYFDGVSVLSLSFLSVLFGILSSITLFRILSFYFSPKQSYKYTLAFVCFSVFHFYSVVILRDIGICFLFLLCFEIIIHKFSISGVLKLVLYMLLAIGFRLYSGLFIAFFIFIYVYKAAMNSKMRYALIALIGIMGVILLYASVGILEQTMDEIELYDEFTTENATSKGGLVGKLLKLPPGIKQVSLSLFSQIAPFPPYLSYQNAYSFSDLYLSTLIVIYEFWWYLISFTLMFILFFKEYINKIDFFSKLLLLAALVYIVANTAHPDIRRMMPVYPILYLVYLQIVEKFRKQVKTISVKRNLVVFYFLMIALYYVIK